ncbi:hypothetical protein ES332_A05G458000v1 [Gossypium tomentosum]|uniref:Uncharacterized protein n=1 Tax=Gossypium tomentosum TaxID=34277 RepID=A0A5D2QSY8_GOSTO|nr:hypothetical protein ES332_A05G458000v1 [Gossypium tomentosum]
MTQFLIFPRKFQILLSPIRRKMPRCRCPSPGRSLCLASRGSSSVSVIPVVFMMVDAIVKAKGISINTVNFKAQIRKGTF